MREALQVSRPAGDRTAPASLRPKLIERKIVRFDGGGSLLTLAPDLSPVRLSASDVTYFDMSRHYILQDMRRWSFVGRFDQHVLRQAMHDDCIRHAVLALSAMCKVTQGQHEEQHQPGQPKWTLTAREFLASQHELREGARKGHYRAALSHYVEATALCRNKLARLSPDTLPSAIIATYIFTVLEMLQGNVEAMGRLLSYNDNLLRMKENVGGSAAPLEGDSADIVTELGDMFHHLSIKCALFPYYNNQRLLYTEPVEPETWPVPTDATPFEMLRKEYEKTIRPIQKFFICVQYVSNKGEAALKECEKQQAAYIAHANQWRLMVTRRLAGKPDPRAQQELRAIKFDVLVTLIFLECSLDPSALLWDTKYAEFQEATELLEKLARDTTSKHIKFLYEFRLFPTAALLITKCRDRAVRQHALDMLVELISRDTRWSGIVLVKGLQTLIDLEEGRRNEDGLIPVSRRYAWVGSRWDFDANQLVVKLRVGDQLPLSTAAELIDLVVQV
jgi:hypothetical protein